MYDSTSTVSIAISYEDNISEQAAKALEQEAQYIKTLQNPYLIGEILNEVQKTIVGEEDTIISLSIQTCTRKVKNSSPESKNIIVNGKSGVGKDAIVTAVCEVMMNDEDYIHKTKLTPEVFTYWHTNDPDWNWDGRVLHIEDPTTELINSQTFKTQASGVKSDVVVKDQKVIEPEHYGKPNMIITTFEGNADVEGIRRWPSITLDTSDEQTKNVLKYISQINSKKKKTEPNHLLRDALHRLIQYNVVIPFANQIDEHFPKTVLMRTYYKRFLDYIKASTVLYQRQREKDDDGYLIATREDYEL